MFFKNDKTEFSAREDGTQLQNREKKYNYKIYTYNEKVKKEFTSLEYDEKSHVILSVTDTQGQKWNCVSLHPTLNAMAPLLMERAVLGARMYRLLLGAAHQPQIHACCGDFYARADGLEKYVQFFRVSQDVPDFRSWDSLRNRGTEQFESKPVVGLTAIKLVANFLGDNNLNGDNVGLKELADVFQAVKIDPEHSFSSLFFSNDFNTMVSDLKNFKDKVPQGFFNQQEFFETLLKIINTPLESYYEIINTTFSDYFAEEKMSYSRMLAYRHYLIRMAAISIDGFSQYIDKKMQQLYNSFIIPEVGNTRLIPEVNSTRLIPEVNNTRLIPEVNNTRLIPEGDNTHLIPEGDNTHLIPEGDNTRLIPEGDNTRLIPEEVQSFHFSKLREEYIEHLPKQSEAQQNLMQFMFFDKPIPISDSLPIVKEQDVPEFKEGFYSLSDFEESSDSEWETDYPMSGGSFF